MKRIYLGLVLVLAGLGSAQAITTDSVILTILPLFNLSINISSTTNTFGSVNIKSSVSICVGQLTNDGNVTSGWQKMTPNRTSASAAGSWSLITSGSTGADTFRLLAVSTGTGVSPTFSGTPANSVILGDSGGLLGVTNAFTELTEGGGAVSPVHNTGETKSLWVSIMLPLNVTSAMEQTITLSVRAASR